MSAQPITLREYEIGKADRLLEDSYQQGLPVRVRVLDLDPGPADAYEYDTTIQLVHSLAEGTIIVLGWNSGETNRCLMMGGFIVGSREDPILQIGYLLAVLNWENGLNQELAKILRCEDSLAL